MDCKICINQSAANLKPEPRLQIKKKQVKSVTFLRECLEVMEKNNYCTDVPNRFIVQNITSFIAFI